MTPAPLQVGQAPSELELNSAGFTPFAKANGVKPALFSSNSEGACPTCNGAGVIYTELGVMATVESTCEECEGRRFQASVLGDTLGGRNIAEVLAMSVA